MPSYNPARLTSLTLDRTTPKPSHKLSRLILEPRHNVTPVHPGSQIVSGQLDSAVWVILALERPLNLSLSPGILSFLKADSLIPHLPALVMIISVPTALNSFHSSWFSKLRLTPGSE